MSSDTLSSRFPKFFRLCTRTESSIWSRGNLVRDRWKWEWEWIWRRPLLDCEIHMLDELCDLINRYPSAKALRTPGSGLRIQKVYIRRSSFTMPSLIAAKQGYI